MAYIQSEYVLKAKKLLKNEFNLGQLPVEQIGRLSLAYIRVGYTEKALETQYKCIKEHPGKLESQNVYFSLFTFLNHPSLADISNFEKKSEEFKPDNNSFLHPDKVTLDCYVQIKNIESSEETEIIIEEDADIYNLDHKLSQELLGKKVGDKILLYDNTYEIMKVDSKYVYRYREIIKEFEKKFLEKSPIRSFTVSRAPNIEEFSKVFKKVNLNISKQEKYTNKIFQYYKERKATIGSIAKITGKHPIEVIGKLIFSSKDKFISSFPPWENDKKIQKLLDDKTNILIDLSSLIMIYQLKIEKYMEESKFNLFTCQSAVDSLKDYIQKTALHSKDGLLTVGLDKEGSLRKNFVSSKIIKQDLNFWMEVKIWAEKYCQIKSISTDIILSREQKREREKILGKEFLDSLLATDRSFILLCEDAILRKYAEQEFSISGVRLFNLIEYFERQAIIDNNQAVKFKAKLVQFNQDYIPIDHNILLFFLKEAEYSTNDVGFQRGLFFLGPISHLPGVINVVANFLIELCQKPSLLPYNKQIITKELLDRSSFGRDESPKQIAYQVIQLVQLRTKLLPILQNEICGYIIEWLKNKIY